MHFFNFMFVFLVECSREKNDGTKKTKSIINYAFGFFDTVSHSYFLMLLMMTFEATPSSLTRSGLMIWHSPSTQ